MIARVIAAIAMACALAACGQDPVPQASSGDDDDRTAEGEVLGGTISDAMLPLDSVRSQSPMMRSVESAEPSGEGPEAPPVAPDGATPAAVPPAQAPANEDNSTTVED